MTDLIELKRLLAQGSLPPIVAALIAENDRLTEEYDKAWRHDLNDKNNAQVLTAEVIRLKAENEEMSKRLLMVDVVHGPKAEMRWKAIQDDVKSLRKALKDVMTQVDGNIRETVRDCVNGHNDVQDIYGYCDAIESLIDAALGDAQ